VMTAQTKINEDESGNVSRMPDVQKGALSITNAAPDYIVYCDVEDNMDHLADDSEPPVNHIVRFGSHPGYRTKARLPYTLRGKLPPILGRKSQTSLVQLSRVLGIGGIPAKTTQKKEKYNMAADGKVTIDLSNYKDRVGSRVAEGTYRVLVEDAEQTEARSGNAMINLFFRIQGGEFDGATIVDRLVLTEKSLFRVVG